MMVVVLACVRIAFGIFSPIISSKDLALAIRAQYQPGDQVVATGLYENASTLNFYGGFPLRSLARTGRQYVVRRAVSGCATGLGDAGVVCEFVEWAADACFCGRTRMIRRPCAD